MANKTINTLKKVKLDGVVYKEHPYTNSDIVEVIGDPQGYNLTERLGVIMTALAAIDVGAEDTNANIQAHISSTENPHGVTKDQVGLDKVTNDKQATKTEFDTFVTNINANIQAHTSSTENPHGVTKDQVGLGNVLNKEQATKTEFNTFVTNTNTSLANKVDKVAGKGLSTKDFTAAAETKLAGISAGAQVNPAIATKDEAEAGTNTINMMTAQRVAQAITSRAAAAVPAASPDTSGKVKISNDIGEATDTALSVKGAKTLKESLEVLTSVGAKPIPMVHWAWTTNVNIGTTIQLNTFVSYQGNAANMANDQRVLLMGQTTSSENGIYKITGYDPMDFTFNLTKLASTEFPVGALVSVRWGKHNDQKFYHKGGTTNEWFMYSDPDRLKTGGGLTTDGDEISIAAISSTKFNNNPTQYNAQSSLGYQLLIEALAYEIKNIKGSDKTFAENAPTLASKQNKIIYDISSSTLPQEDGDIVFEYTLE